MTTFASLFSRPGVRRFVSAPVLGALALAMLATPLMAHEFKAGSLEIDHPWARATPGGAKVGAGYLVVKNTGTAPDRLVAGAAPFAGRVEIHEMAVTDGVMTMRPLPDGLEIPAGGTVTLKPGSYHIMFMELKEPLKVGTRVDGTLTFEKAGTVAVQFEVESVGSTGKTPGMDHGGGQGHDH